MHWLSIVHAPPFATPPPLLELELALEELDELALEELALEELDELALEELEEAVDELFEAELEVGVPVLVCVVELLVVCAPPTPPEPVEVEPVYCGILS